MKTKQPEQIQTKLRQRMMTGKVKRAGLAMFLGVVLLVGALFLLIHNNRQDRQAAASSQKLLAQLYLAISERQSEESSAELLQKDERQKKELNDFHYFPMEKDKARLDSTTSVTCIEIDGHVCIGCLSIPALNLELPVLSACDREGLDIGPCRQFGSIEDYDMTIAGHNYAGHFGKLHLLQAGDRIVFTDVEGKVHSFFVTGKELVAATAVEEVRNCGGDLTLYTCTYGGLQRLLVACRARPE